MIKSNIEINNYLGYLSLSLQNWVRFKNKKHSEKINSTTDRVRYGHCRKYKIFYEKTIFSYIILIRKNKLS